MFAPFLTASGGQILLGVDPPNRLLVDEQHALQHAMLAHQIFRRRNALFILLVLGPSSATALLRRTECGRDQQPDAGDAADTKECASIVRRQIDIVLIRHQGLQSRVARNLLPHYTAPVPREADAPISAPRPTSVT